VTLSIREESESYGALPGLLSLNEVMRGPVVRDHVSPTDRERQEASKAGKLTPKRTCRRCEIAVIA